MGNPGPFSGALGSSRSPAKSTSDPLERAAELKDKAGELPKPVSSRPPDVQNSGEVAAVPNKSPA